MGSPAEAPTEHARKRRQAMEWPHRCPRENGGKKLEKFWVWEKRKIEDKGARTNILTAWKSRIKRSSDS